MRFPILAGACVLAAVPPAALAAEVQETTPADWTETTGEATAARLIQACVAPPHDAPSKKMACFRVALEACLRDNGSNQSQYDLNVCGDYSAQAWRARYDRVMARADALMARWAQAPADSGKASIAARFSEQEQLWRDWAKADCEMRERLSVGGSLHSFSVTLCASRHVAARTLDLENQIDWWETR